MDKLTTTRTTISIVTPLMEAAKREAEARHFSSVSSFLEQLLRERYLAETAPKSSAEG